MSLKRSESVFHFEFAVLPHLIGGMWMILGFLTLAAALVRALPTEAKSPLVGLGLSNIGFCRVTSW